MSGGMAMSNYRAYKEKALQNPEVKPNMMLSRQNTTSSNH